MNPHFRLFHRLPALGTVAMSATLAFVTLSLHAQEKKKNPSSKIYVASMEGQSQINQGDKIADLTQKSAYNAEGIYVCRFNRAYRKHIRLYMKALRNGKNEVLGVVLNGLSPRRIEYYTNYRYYRSYKKYYGSQG